MISLPLVTVKTQGKGSVVDLEATMSAEILIWIRLWLPIEDFPLVTPGESLHSRLQRSAPPVRLRILSSPASW